MDTIYIWHVHVNHALKSKPGFNYYSSFLTCSHVTHIALHSFLLNVRFLFLSLSSKKVAFCSHWVSFQPV